jgi:hypothetical protein
MNKNARPALAINLLGPFRVAVLGKVVKDSHGRGRRTIWPDPDTESAASNLHKIIHMTRRALEPNLKSGAASQFIRTTILFVELAATGGLWSGPGPLPLPA